MLAKVKKQISNDPLWAGIAGVGAIACMALLFFGDPNPEWAAKLEAWSEMLGGFVLLALTRWKQESTDAS